MAHNSMPSDSELDALMIELLTPRSSKQEASPTGRHGGEASLTDV